jgi:hypothetical protein
MDPFSYSLRTVGVGFILGIGRKMEYTLERSISNYPDVELFCEEKHPDN